MAAHISYPEYSTPTRSGSRSRSGLDDEELGSMSMAIGAIWVSVLAISVLSPDMVSGSEQQHMPVAAFGTWLWGLLATWAVLGAWGSLRRSPHRRHLHRPLSIAVATTWFVAAGVSVFGPVVETGSDPTRLPFAAMLAPIAATMLTAVARVGIDAVGRLVDPLDPLYGDEDEAVDPYEPVG
jgi:hypothetical protein